MNKPNLIQIIKKTGMFRTQEEVKEIIKSGRVRVKGKVVRDIYYQARALNVEIDGKPIPQVKEKAYFILNKPRGYSCHKTDARNIWQLFKVSKEIQNTLYSVGRLDVDTTGMLILSNDGSIMHKILKPEKNIWKTYVIASDKELRPSDIDLMKKGITIMLEEGKYQCLPAQIERIGNKTYEIKIQEGKKRQIRRMFEAVGAKVINLKRLAIGGLKLPDIKEGEYKKVRKEDLEKIFE